MLKWILIAIILVCLAFLLIQTLNGNLIELSNNPLPKEEYPVGVLSIPGMIHLVGWTLLIGVVAILSILFFSKSRREGKHKR